MTTKDNKRVSLSFRLSNELKQLIEEAATAIGQSVSEYAVTTLVSNSQKVLKQRQATVLSNRDRKAFMTLLDEAHARPNRALTRAAKRYQKRA